MQRQLTQSSFWRMPRTIGFGLTLAGLCTLSAAVTRPAMAQNLTYTLSGVTFSDGCVATGYFIFNPATQSFGSFSISTTDGQTDSVLGGTYAAPETSPFKSGLGGVAAGNGYFEFDNSVALRFLGLATSAEASSPGSIPLALAPIGFVSSQEDAGSVRTITAGFLDITAPAAVPEASTTVSLSLLLALGAGGIILAKRRAKTAASSPIA